MFTHHPTLTPNCPSTPQKTPPKPINQPTNNNKKKPHQKTPSPSTCVDWIQIYTEFPKSPSLSICIYTALFHLYLSVLSSNSGTREFSIKGEQWWLIAAWLPPPFPIPSCTTMDSLLPSITLAWMPEAMYLYLSFRSDFQVAKDLIKSTRKGV